MIAVIDDIPVTWTEVEKALSIGLANEMEIGLVKKGYDYYSGGANTVYVGQVVCSIKSIFGIVDPIYDRPASISSGWFSGWTESGWKFSSNSSWSIDF